MTSSPDSTSDHRTAVLIAVFGTLLVCAYAGLAALQILVLNPLAAALGRDLDEIRADMTAAGESLSTPAMVGVLGLGVALAILLLVLITVRRDTTPTAAMLGYLVLLAFGAPAYFIASFGAGMGLADTYMISGADYSPWAIPLYLTSLIGLVAALTIGAIDLARRHRRLTHQVAGSARPASASVE